MTKQFSDFKATALAAKCRAAHRAGFWGDQTGSLTIFGLMFLLLMVMMGGLAVDVMRYEARRTSLQNTLDRSTLAAASLTQNRVPTAVVNDYFQKAGLLSYLRSVTVTQGLNFRNVNATADADTNPMFMHMMGIDKLDAFGNSTAEQRINNVEIMLVLDVSGSMSQNSKITNLKTAANQFVSSMLTNDLEHKISIGMVPFNGQINLGNSLATKFNLTDLNGLPASTPIQAGVNCVDLPASVYASYAIPLTLPLSNTSNVDTASGTGTGSAIVTPIDGNRWCPFAAIYTGNPMGTGGNIVRLPQQNIATLQGYINGLNAIGHTSINAGIKWGMTFLDPSVQSIYNAAMTAGTMPATMATRPLAYGAKDAMKVIVLMSDGDHTSDERVNITGSIAGVPYTFKTGPSPMWQATSDGKYSIFLASKVVNTNATTVSNSRPYWVPTSMTASATGTWQSRPWNGTTPPATDHYVVGFVPQLTTNQTWPQVWSKLGMQYVAQYFFAKPLAISFTTVLNTMRTQTATTTMDTQLQTACTAAKANGVIIYSIAFENTVGNGATQLRNCSTDSVAGSHYFEAAGVQITSAFASIANNISQLRLTQ